MAARLGATVVHEPVAGYGAAVHAGLLAATTDYVAFMDGDGSFDPDDLLALLDDVRSGRADIAVGRRRPVSRGVWPWHARLGNNLVVWWLRRRIGMAAHDIAPMRVCRREALLDLGVQDRRFGYPVELLQKATAGRLARLRARRRLPPARPRHPLEGVRLGPGHDARGPRLLAGAGMTLSVLVVAKAPETGRVKTRLGAEIGMERAAVVAAAALLDTLAAATSAVGAGHCHLSLDGDLERAVRGPELREALTGWTVHPQRGAGFGARLADAHARVRGPVVQVGMDTPHATADLLLAAAAGLADHDAVLGPAEDGGWWVLALRDPGHAAVLSDVPMSTSTTGVDTLAALVRAGLDVGTTATLRDVDEVADADAVARLAPGSRFAEAWGLVSA